MNDINEQKEMFTEYDYYYSFTSTLMVTQFFVWDSRTGVATRRLEHVAGASCASCTCRITFRPLARTRGWQWKVFERFYKGRRLI